MRKTRRRAEPPRTGKGIEAPAAQQHERPRECLDPVLRADDPLCPLWWTKIEVVMGENPEAADSLAHVFQILKEAIESGPEGVARACFMLSDGIRMAYESTEAHQKALCLYHLHLAGRLREEDEPLQLITAAIARADPEKG